MCFVLCSHCLTEYSKNEVDTLIIILHIKKLESKNVRSLPKVPQLEFLLR